MKYKLLNIPESLLEEITKIPMVANGDIIVDKVTDENTTIIYAGKDSDAPEIMLTDVAKILQSSDDVMETPEEKEKNRIYWEWMKKIKGE